MFVKKVIKKGALALMLTSLSGMPAWAADKVNVLMSTSLGDVELELDRERAPITVENFVRYAESGYYDGTIFHRVIRDFMIQGGGYTPAMEKKSTQDPIQNEAKNGMKNIRGSIAMARTRDPHSATSQFYINHADNSNLDYPSYDGWGYAVFGEVVDGMDVVDAIASEPTGVTNGMRDVPKTPILITQVTVCPRSGCVREAAAPEAPQPVVKETTEAQ